LVNQITIRPRGAWSTQNLNEENGFKMTVMQNQVFLVVLLLWIV